MRILIHRIIHEPEQNRVRLTVQIGDAPLKDYLADYQVRDDGLPIKSLIMEDGSPLAIHRYCGIEQEFFMLLSELAVADTATAQSINSRSWISSQHFSPTNQSPLRPSSWAQHISVLKDLPRYAFYSVVSDDHSSISPFGGKTESNARSCDGRREDQLDPLMSSLAPRHRAGLGT